MSGHGAPDTAQQKETGGDSGTVTHVVGAVQSVGCEQGGTPSQRPLMQVPPEQSACCAHGCMQYDGSPGSMNGPTHVKPGQHGIMNPWIPHW
jgi:hypothetical protein